MSDDFVVPPPASVTVFHDRRAVLYFPDGRALVRRAGFAMTQTTSVNPSTSDRVKKTIKTTIKPKGKRG